MPTVRLVVRAIWAARLFIGATNHALTLLPHGTVWAFGGVGLGLKVVGALLSVWPECGWQADIVRASKTRCILRAHGSPWAYTSLASASAS
jgi:hypothetical protein